MTWCYDEEVENEFDSTYDFESNIDVEFDFDSDWDSYLDVDHDIDIDVDIEGNEATYAIDLQAFGDDGAVDLNLVVIADEDFASITATGYAAVA